MNTSITYVQQYCGITDLDKYVSNLPPITKGRPPPRKRRTSHRAKPEAPQEDSQHPQHDAIKALDAEVAKEHQEQCHSSVQEARRPSFPPIKRK